MRRYIQDVRLLDRNIQLFLVTVVVTGFTVFGGMFPTLLNLFLVRLGYGPEFVGLFNSVGALTMAASCLIAGAIGGRWGSRRMMIVGLIVLAVGNGMLSLVEMAPSSWRREWLLGMNVLAAMGIALYVVNGSPFLMGITSERQRHLVFSVQAALGPLAAFAGSLIGGFLPGLFAGVFRLSLDQATPYGYPLLLASVLLLPAALALLPTPEVRDSGTTSAASGAAPVGLMLLLGLVIMLQVASEGIGRTFFNLYLDTGLRLPASQIGLLAGLGQLLAAPAALFTPLLVARWGGERTYIAATIGMGLSLLPLALIPHWGAAGLGFAGLMALAAVTRPAISVYSMEIVNPAWRGVMAGTTATAVGISWAAMGLGGGYLIPLVGYPPLFGLGALLTIVGALLFWALFRKPRNVLVEAVP